MPLHELQMNERICVRVDGFGRKNIRMQVGVRSADGVFACECGWVYYTSGIQVCYEFSTPTAINVHQLGRGCIVLGNVKHPGASAEF